MSSAHKALIWGYKIIEKTFMGGQINNLPVDGVDRICRCFASKFNL
jgi:hypothetical protein